jgi:hypothetical protein
MLSAAELNDRRCLATKMALSGVTIAAVGEQRELVMRKFWGAVKEHGQDGLPTVTLRHWHLPQGAGRALSRKQKREALRLLCYYYPDRSRMSYALWTRQAVGALIAWRLKDRLAARAAGQYLTRWGSTPRRPLKKTYGQRSAPVDGWISGAHPRIDNAPKATGVEIQWVDEPRLRSGYARGFGNTPKRKTPLMPADASAA